MISVWKFRTGSLSGSSVIPVPGKSTLIQHLNGLFKATSGAIYYNGENIYRGRLRHAKPCEVRWDWSFSIRSTSFLKIDVFTDVCFGPKNLGLSKEEAEERAEKALTAGRTWMRSYYKQSPFELSGGQKSACGHCRCACHAAGGADPG